jgi:pimeloyl-ACP methyl ester carboxylesterase
MTTWVLLRGLTREARHWARLPDKLRASGIDGEIVLADLPGNGGHARLRSPASVPAMIEFIVAELARLGYSPPYRVMAMSLGAMVAAAWAQGRPQDIECLVLINTSMRPFSGATERLRPSAWMGLLGAAWRWRDRRQAEATIHRLTCNRADTLDVDLDEWVEIYRSAPVARANALRQLWAAARFQAALQAPRCPTLVLSSREDRLVSPACSKQLAAAWQATHLEHPWAGHDLPHDDPAWVSDRVVAWGATSFKGPFSGR